jgi:2-polyprenyl-6-methoxyphenol hydroxylase-like FAD-dependent oxidoreductase
VSRGELNNRLLAEAERVPGVTLHFGHRCEDVDLDKAPAFSVGKARSR